MRTLLVALLLLIPGLSARAEGPAVEGIKENCAEEWRDDFRMQKFCRERQFKAIEEFVAITTKIEGDKTRERIMEKCGSEWPKGKTLDWRMVVYCYKRQSEAYEALSR